jgi:hypothetical protein
LKTKEESMKRTLFNVAVILPLLVAAFLFGVRYGHVKRQSSDQRCEQRATASASQSEQVAGMTYIMQWDDTTKKLLFNGQPLSHWANTGSWKWSSRRFRVESPAPAAVDGPDEYSFHVVPCRGSVDERDAAGLLNRNGQLRYLLDWDDHTERFLFHGEPTKHWGTYNSLIASNESLPASSPSYPSPWEATLPGCNTINTRQSRIR